ncbi:Aste57867_9734 [Aphanomyces stellatus]|uniref:Aste57867_9734 protein n=1 Tax=Aphanomyces stellatus TaxID=120398 RepID=A0A485KP75_9STRA|nr:hypothetical protein As57867_009696 [Aphanomyces stellatus]VFT86613.1 Aste57867_9734 [Aphanomyces stellatus]
MLGTSPHSAAAAAAFFGHAAASNLTAAAAINANIAWPTSTPPPSLAATAYSASAGLLVSCIAGLTAISTAIFLLTRRRERHAPTYPSTEYALLQWRDVPSMRIDMARLVLTRHLASGSTGDVYVGTYADAPVAVKTLALTKRSAKHVQRFVDEISLLARVRGPCILHVVGAAWHPSDPASLHAVLEYMDLGDLASFLDRTPPTAFPFDHKLHCALNLARALAHLHSLDVLHRDLTSHNVLLDSTCGTKLADFGVARTYVQGQNDAMLSGGRGTYRWMAPEMLLSHEYDASVYVFSLGVVLTELETHREPYSELTGKTNEPLDDSAVLGLVLHGHQRPTFTEACPPWFKALAMVCMEQDPAARPTAYDVIQVLERHIPELI